MSLRIGGVAALIGGVLWPLGFLIANLGDAWVGFGSAIHVAGSVGLLVALIGLSAFQARHHPLLVWTAFLLPAFGAAATIVGMGAMATLGDSPLVAGFSGWYVWMIGLLATLAGSALFGTVSYLVRSVSRPAATILAVGPVVAFVVFAVVSGGLIGRPIGMVVATVGALVFAAGWVSMGIRALWPAGALQGARPA